MCARSSAAAATAASATTTHRGFGDSSGGAGSAEDSLPERRWRLWSLYPALAVMAAIQAIVYPLMFAYPQGRFPSRYFGRVVALETFAQVREWTK